MSQEQRSDSTGVDQPGDASFAMAWPVATTPLEAIERSLYRLAAEVSGTVDVVDAEWKVVVYPRSAVADVASLAHRLRQDVTDQTLRVRIAERTDPIRNLVFALAFSRSGIAASDSASGPS